MRIASDSDKSPMPTKAAKPIAPRPSRLANECQSVAARHAAAATHMLAMNPVTRRVLILMKDPLGLLLPADYAVPKNQGEQRSD